MIFLAYWVAACVAVLAWLWISDWAHRKAERDWAKRAQQVEADRLRNEWLARMARHRAARAALQRLHRRTTGGNDAA